MRRLQLRDKHVIITGGSSGIGLATTRRLVTLGARVSIVALDDEYLEELRRHPLVGDHPVHLEAADVADRPRLESALERSVSVHGPCDVLLTCAGIVHPGYFEDLPVEEFEREMAVDYFGTLYAIKAVVGSMMERGEGTIACVSSTAGLLGVFGYSAYGPAKYAVRGLCDIIRYELRPHGIHVACVFPSDVDTPQLAYEEPLKPAELRAVSGTIRPIPPGQVADAIVKGIVRRRPVIYAEARTRAVARLAGTAPGFTRFYLNRVVAKAARARPRP
ncbi:MAG: SDR family oxidoreductase [Acidimicrobiia bacterium]|nr:SDR family oxidoreductase [Acidimicrobiia bacterium]NNF87998.1 SDR family oxidoreductase [Acidimicrobiia bacterium]NNL70381.1 SDR family oxidoreductase [Acidimicrobiia bacterium]